MTWKINASEVETDPCDGENCALLFLAERTPHGRSYLCLSRCAGSRKGVCIERDDQGFSCYGGIKQVRLGNGVLHVLVDQHAAVSLGDMTSFEVTLGDAVKSHVPAIEEVLRVLFDGDDARLLCIS